MKNLLPRCLAGAALVLSLSGCRSTPVYTQYPPAQLKAGLAQTVTLTNRLNPAWLTPPTNQFTLGPGDRVEIELLDDPTSRVTTVVGPDGKIYFNLLPGLDVWGLTLGQAKALMEQNLAQYIRGTPRLNLTLRSVESKRIWLLGRFQQPGVYTLPAPTTLLEAIAMAGGSLTFAGSKEVTGGPLGEDLADLRRSFVVRNGQLLPVDFDLLLNRGDLRQNIYLQSDDFVYFSPAFTREVFVLGAVVQPQAVPYSDGMTLAGAIAGAYGTVRDAYLYHVAVIRGSLTQPEVTVVNYYDIVHGRTPDLPLEPHDIVYVPLAPYRYLRKFVEIALNTFVSSMAINAGSRAVPNGAAGGGSGIFIPIGSGIQITPPSPPPIH